jgi:hypothetical protein
VTSNEAVLKVVSALEDAGVAYMLTGSYASNLYGVARATQDADFVVELTSNTMRTLTTRLGSEFHVDPQMTFENVTATNRYVVRVLGSRFKIELFLVGDDPHDRVRFSRRRPHPFLGRTVFVPTAEDVVITKLRWSQSGQRRKDADDVRNVIAVQSDRLDWDFIYRWADQHGTRMLLEEIRRSIPPL